MSKIVSIFRNLTSFWSGISLSVAVGLGGKSLRTRQISIHKLTYANLHNAVRWFAGTCHVVSLPIADSFNFNLLHHRHVNKGGKINIQAWIVSMKTNRLKHEPRRKNNTKRVRKVIWKNCQGKDQRVTNPQRQRQRSQPVIWQQLNGSLKQPSHLQLAVRSQHWNTIIK